MLVLGIINLGITGGDDEDNAFIVQLEGERFGDTRRLTACGLCCQLNGGAGGGELNDAFICSELL